MIYVNKYTGDVESYNIVGFRADSELEAGLLNEMTVSYHRLLGDVSSCNFFLIGEALHFWTGKTSLSSVIKYMYLALCEFGAADDLSYYDPIARNHVVLRAEDVKLEIENYIDPTTGLDGKQILRLQRLLLAVGRPDFQSMLRCSFALMTSSEVPQPGYDPYIDTPATPLDALMVDIIENIEDDTLTRGQAVHLSIDHAPAVRTLARVASTDDVLVSAGIVPDEAVLSVLMHHFAMKHLPGPRA